MWNEDDPDDVVLAMVARTGVNSTIGNMLRKALRPASYLSVSDSLVQVCLCASAICSLSSCRQDVSATIFCAQNRRVSLLVCYSADSLLLSVGYITLGKVQTDIISPLFSEHAIRALLCAAQHFSLCMCVAELCQMVYWVFA